MVLLLLPLPPFLEEMEVLVRTQSTPMLLVLLDRFLVGLEVLLGGYLLTLVSQQLPARALQAVSAFGLGKGDDNEIRNS
jgi:hypothetical protein